MCLVTSMQNFLFGFENAIWRQRRLVKGSLYSIHQASGSLFFTIFWICYQATLKEKVVWKFSNNTCYLLDFNSEASSVPKAYGSFQLDDSCPGEVLEDPDAWLFIDGEQSCSLHHECHILLACSGRDDNHNKFSKNLMVITLYILVWTKEEITKFMGDFEVPKAKY